MNTKKCDSCGRIVIDRGSFRHTMHAVLGKIISADADAASELLAIASKINELRDMYVVGISPMAFELLQENWPPQLRLEEIEKGLYSVEPEGSKGLGSLYLRVVNLPINESKNEGEAKSS